MRKCDGLSKCEHYETNKCKHCPHYVPSWAGKKKKIIVECIGETRRWRYTVETEFPCAYIKDWKSKDVDKVIFKDTDGNILAVKTFIKKVEESIEWVIL